MELNGERHGLEDGSAVVIPSGTEHNVVNTSSTEALRLYTLYSPPEHPDGTEGAGTWSYAERIPTR